MRFALLFLLLTSWAAACNVPVFRYALERWEPDPFQLIIFHREPIPNDLQRTLKDLEPLVDAPDARPNLKTLFINVSDAIPALYSDLYSRQKNLALPSFALCTPEWVKGDAPMESGAFDANVLTRLIDSPRRKEIANHTLKGTAITWVVLETEDAAANDALVEKLSKESQRLAQLPLIPAKLEKDGVNLLSSLPVEVSFATVRFRADDPSESLLVKMLTDGNPVKEPTLFPIFGRGRALAAMPANTVSAELLEETARFLCGACSCQVKAQNPGFDLLFHTHWQKIFGDDEVPMPEKRTQEPPKPIYIPIPKGKKP